VVLLKAIFEKFREIKKLKTGKTDIFIYLKPETILTIGLICVTESTVCTSGFITHQNGKISGFQL